LKYFKRNAFEELAVAAWKVQTIDGHLRDTVYSHIAYYKAFHNINNYGDKIY